MREFNYVPITEQLKQKEQQRELAEDFMKKYPAIDERVYNPGHTFTENEITMLIKNAYPIKNDKQNTDVLNAFDKVYKNYVSTGNNKMINRMIDIFNLYFQPYSGKDNKTKTVLGSFDYNLSDVYGSRSCYIETSRLPKDIEKGLLKKYNEIQNISLKTKTSTKNNGLEF